MTRLGLLALLVAGGLWACDDDSSPPVGDGKPDKTLADGGPDGKGGDGAAGSARSYVIKTVDVPTTQTEADKYSFDYNNDSKKDNQLGAVLMAISGAISGLDLEGEMNQNVRNGNVVSLFRITADDFTTDASASLQAWTGDPATCCATRPCSESDANQSCFNGSFSFKVAADSPKNAVLTAKITSGQVEAGPGEVEALLPIGNFPAKVTLKRARLQATVAGGGLTSGTLTGVVTKADIDSKVIPSVAKVLDGELKEATTKQQVKDAITNIFDANKDGTISEAEVKDNGLIKLLLAGDVDVDNDGTKEFSAGIGFTGVTCTITGT